MHAAGDCAQQLLLPAAAGICGGTRASEAARPDFHRLSSLRQPPAPGGAVARGGAQTEAEYQQAASRAQGLSVPSARQDDRPGEPSVGSRHNLYPDAAGIFVRRVLSWRLSNTRTAGFCVAVHHKRSTKMLSWQRPRPSILIATP